MVGKKRYRDKEGGMKSFDFQPSKLKRPLVYIINENNSKNVSVFLCTWTCSMSHAVYEKCIVLTGLT